MAGKQYQVVRDFRHSNPKSPFEDTHYTVGDSYSHAVNDNQTAPGGTDGKGPVLAEKATPSSTSNQEK